jgi:hypothetical protein
VVVVVPEAPEVEVVVSPGAPEVVVVVAPEVVVSPGAPEVVVSPAEVVVVLAPVELPGAVVVTGAPEVVVVSVELPAAVVVVVPGAPEVVVVLTPAVVVVVPGAPEVVVVLALVELPGDVVVTGAPVVVVFMGAAVVVGARAPKYCKALKETSPAVNCTAQHCPKGQLSPCLGIVVAAAPGASHLPVFPCKSTPSVGSLTKVMDEKSLPLYCSGKKMRTTKRKKKKIA